jgi:hypothetical protein
MEDISGIRYKIVTGDRMVFTGVQFVIMQDCAVCGETIGLILLDTTEEIFWLKVENKYFMDSVAKVLNEFGWLIDMDKKTCRCPDCKDGSEPDTPQAPPISKELEKAIRRINTDEIQRITKGVDFKEQQKQKYNPFEEF